MARPEKTVLALRVRQEQSQCLSCLVISTLFAASNIDKTEERLSQAEATSKFNELVWLTDQTA